MKTKESNSLSNSLTPSNVLDFKNCNLLFENLKWLTSREAVVYLRLPSEGALRNLVYRKKIPYSKLGRRLRFEKEALDNVLRFSETKRRIA